jgi:hypothetical protein
MAAKRMVSLRLPPQLTERIDRLAEGEGVTRTEWCAQALARQAVRASGTGGWRGQTAVVLGEPNEPLVAWDPAQLAAPLVGSAGPQAGDEAVDGGG